MVGEFIVLFIISKNVLVNIGPLTTEVRQQSKLISKPYRVFILDVLLIL